MNSQQLEQLQKEEKKIAYEEHREKMLERQEREFQSKIIKALIHIGAKLLIFSIIALIPVAIALALVTLLVGWIYPVEFPYNLYFQLPIAVLVIWRVWRFLEEKE